MKKFIFFLTFTFLFSNVSYADTVSKFVFTTDPQTIGVNTSSETITVQSQNSSGLAEDITETHDIVFTSTSLTGEFLSTSGNPVSTTMSKNTANKNFLYRDLTAGTYTITVVATGRTSLNTFSTTQQIIVGTITNPVSTTTSPAETPPASEDGFIPVSTPAGSSSAHSSPVSLGTTGNKMEFEVSAGRDRLTSIGNLLVLQASPTKLQNISEQTVTYQWSFGDGTVAQGKMVSHSYRFPGEYAVIVNAGAGEKQAVSRLVVRVVSPDFSLNRISGGLEITNKSNVEVNLEGWNLKGDKKAFVFPKDTLIPAGKRVTFADDVTGLDSGRVDLLNPLGKGFANITIDTSSPTLVSQSASTSIEIIALQTKINSLKTELARQISPQFQNNSVVALQVQPPTQKPVTLLELASTTQEEDSQSGLPVQLGNTATVFEATKQTGVITRIFSWPIRGLNFVRQLFIEG